MSRLLPHLLVPAAVALVGGTAFAAAPPPPHKPALELSFKDIRYLTRTLDDLPKSKAYVLVFTTTSCPLVTRYLPTINRLERSIARKACNSWR
jgi:hypothetical protein